jgi:glutamate carboxypeptidase
MPEQHADALRSFLDEHQQEMVALVERMVLAESPSSVPESQQGVLAILVEAFMALDYQIRLIPGKRSGGHLYARPKGRHRRRPLQLLLGHCDTVWPVGTLKEMPLEIADGRMKGPGTYDMKGGLVQAIFALRALGKLGLEPAVTPVVFINSEEEIGSFESGRYIHRLARVASRAFVMEPSLGPSGKLKTARKGVGGFTVKIKGKAAHAGLNPEGGASAILELSHQIQELFALNDPVKGVTVNVGKIDGGLQANVIAPESVAHIDARVPTRADAERVAGAIYNLKPMTPGVSLQVEGGFRRPPMEPTARNQALWRAASKLAGAMDLPLDQAAAGGGSDGNTASLYTATLDGLGAVGDGAHAAHEHIYPEMMPERACLLALLLMLPPINDQGGEKG